MRKEFLSGRTKNLGWRKTQLEQLLRMLDEQKDAICEAIYKDLRKVGPISGLHSLQGPQEGRSFQWSTFFTRTSRM